LVEHSALSVKRTLEEVNVPRSTCSRWCQREQAEREIGLIDQRPNPRQIWNRIPQEVKQPVVKLALNHPDRSPRQLAWLFTDQQGYCISETSTFRILKGYARVERPVSNAMRQRVVANRLPVLQDPGMGLVLSLACIG